jgi:hypothetical protein
MRTFDTITTALICCSISACALDQAPGSEAVLDEESRTVGEPTEVRATRGMCEDAVDDGADIWQLMCGAAGGAALLTGGEVAMCLREHMQGRAAGHNKCSSSCPTACFALSSRWDLYYEERAPMFLKSICVRARNQGQAKCLSSC